MKERDKIQSGPPDAGLKNRIADFSRASVFSPGMIIIPAAAVLVIVLIVFILSDTPARTLYFFFIGPFRNIYSFGNMLNASIPLILGALGITVAMKAGNLNLGGEGQIYLGAFITTIAAIALSRFSIMGGLIAAVAGILASGAMAAFSGFCRAKWDANELITTFLFSCAVIPVVNYFITGPLADPAASLQSTGKIAQSMRLTLILKPSNLNTGIFIGAAAVVIVHFFLYGTGKGYEFRMAGYNEIFARYGGINTKLNTVLAMAVSGGFYGLAGSVAVLGTYHAAVKEFSSGMGWNGLAVALIACFYPPAIIPAALFFAWIGAGARIAMQNTGLNFETASIVQAVIFFLATSLVIRDIFSRKRKNRQWKV
ncbi:MAG: ABC transporter permease [Treponema sp.]|nr:ABC transporter permease [Treponema sp.]